MADALLSLAGVNTHIGQYHILHGVDFEVPRGGLTMLLGRNGAGKTTCLRTIMGLWPASSGAITFAGRRIDADLQAHLQALCDQMGAALHRALIDREEHRARDEHPAEHLDEIAALPGHAAQHLQREAAPAAVDAAQHDG